MKKEIKALVAEGGGEIRGEEAVKKRKYKYKYKKVGNCLNERLGSGGYCGM